MRPLTIKHTTFGEGTPKICIPIIGRREEDILEAAETITTLPADVVEWRADHYEAVAEPGAVPPILGHESVKTTLDTYSHLYPDKDQKLADRLNQFRRTPPPDRAVSRRNIKIK